MPRNYPGQHFDSKNGKVRVGMTVPCGKCISCLAARSAQWAVRCYHESQLHERNCFITLTYDDDHLPPDGLINPKHLSDFWRELRRKLPPKSIRYFACGEYGEQTNRPHYHALIFGADFRVGSVPVMEGFYSHPEVAAIWKNGMISISSVTMATCCYVAGYATKKLGSPDTFMRMSNKPGIGHGWLDKYEKEIRNNQCVVIDGKKLPIPKKYFEWEWMDDLKMSSLIKSKIKRKTVSQRNSQHINATQRFKNRNEKI